MVPGILIFKVVFVALAFAIKASAHSPTVHLDDAVFSGAVDGPTNKFLGIPYAQPPYVAPKTLTTMPPADIVYSKRIGDLRFRLPQPLDPYSGTVNATAFGFSCPQQIPANVTVPSQFADLQPFFDYMLEALVETGPAGEDCKLHPDHILRA